MKKLTNWLLTNKILVFPRRILQYMLLSMDIAVVSYHDPERSKVFNLIKKIQNEKGKSYAPNEGYQIFMAVKRTKKVNGDIAEVGVYRGASAKLICEAKGERSLHLFDTFEGLPELDEKDDSSQFYKGQYIASFEEVQNYLRKYSNVHIYKGFFPFSAEPIKDKKFSFINLDVDIYESTLDSLKFFYPRMNKGG